MKPAGMLHFASMTFHPRNMNEMGTFLRYIYLFTFLRPASPLIRHSDLLSLASKMRLIHVSWCGAGFPVSSQICMYPSLSPRLTKSLTLSARPNSCRERKRVTESHEQLPTREGHPSIFHSRSLQSSQWAERFLLLLSIGF